MTGPLAFLNARTEISAVLHASPEYQAALRDAESDSWDGPGVDVETMIEAARERRRGPKP